MELHKAERIIRHEIRFAEYEGPESIDEIIRLLGWKHPGEPGGGLDPIRRSGDGLWFIIKSDYERESLEKGMIIYHDDEEGPGAMTKKDFEKFLGKHKYLTGPGLNKIF